MFIITVPVSEKQNIQAMGIIDEKKTFINREHAGRELGKLLMEKYRDKKALVLGIPRGGVIIACEIAEMLNAEISVILTKKLPHPGQHELAIGAVAEDGSVFLTSSGRAFDQQTIQRIVMNQTLELRSRIERFRQGKSLPSMHGRIVIIADDGIATGSTIVPAIKLCKSRKAGRVVVAAPVAGRNYLDDINVLSDEVVIVDQPEIFYSVGQVYEDFRNLSDDEVLSALAKSYGRRNS